MKAYDKLVYCEVMILQFELRLKNDDFDYLIWITRDVLQAFELLGNLNNEIKRISEQKVAISSYAGTRSKDALTLDAFDGYKRFLLTEMRKVKMQIDGVEQTVAA